MTVEERITIIKAAIDQAVDIVEETLPAPVMDDLRPIAFGQVLNQLIYAGIEEWGETQVDVAPEVKGTVEDAAKARSS